MTCIVMYCLLWLFESQELCERNFVYVKYEHPRLMIALETDPANIIRFARLFSFFCIKRDGIRVSTNVSLQMCFCITFFKCSDTLQNDLKRYVCFFPLPVCC